jgi:5-methylthioadenosine/S-adenosylhomocysteine deaminase
MVQRDDFVIRNAFVMTMDAHLGDLPNADVHVRDGSVVAVGAELAAPGAEVIDGRGMLVLPGLVETHWHLWTTLLRSMSGDRKEHGYFPTSRAIGAFYTAEDMYRAARLAAAEAVYSGITFVHDWCHNVREPLFAESSLRALREAGIRARFSYGIPTRQANEAPIDMAHVSRLHDRWSDHCNGGLLSLGLAWRGAVSQASLRDYAAARELGLPVSVHANASQAGAGGIAALAAAKLLGPHVQVIHAIWCSPEEIRALADSGASVSLSPYTEMRIGFGMPITGDFLAAGVAVGLSVDTPALSGNADMFAIMKAIQNIENGRARDEFRLPARRVLELATIEGARSLGLDAEIGSLVPGKRADLIMINTRQVNLAVFSEPAHLLVEAAQPSNVDTVVVDGRILKRGGQLTSVDVTAIIDEAAAAAAALRQRRLAVACEPAVRGCTAVPALDSSAGSVRLRAMATREFLVGQHTLTLAYEREGEGAIVARLLVDGAAIPVTYGETESSTGNSGTHTTITLPPASVDFLRLPIGLVEGAEPSITRSAAGGWHVLFMQTERLGEIYNTVVYESVSLSVVFLTMTAATATLARHTDTST